jgi:hypothetical protein
MSSGKKPGIRTAQRLASANTANRSRAETFAELTEGPSPSGSPIASRYGRVTLPGPIGSIQRRVQIQDKPPDVASTTDQGQQQVGEESESSDQDESDSLVQEAINKDRERRERISQVRQQSLDSLCFSQLT